MTYRSQVAQSWSAMPLVRADPDIGQPQEAFDGVVAVLDAPALIVQGHRVLRRQYRRVRGVGEVAAPRAVVQDADEADLLALGTVADPDERVPGLRGVAQHRDSLIDQVGFGPRDEGDVGRAQLEKDPVIDVAQVEEEQGAWRERSQDRRPGTLIVRVRVLLVPHLPRQTGADIEQGCHPSGQGGVLPLPQQPNAPDEW